MDIPSYDIPKPSIRTILVEVCWFLINVAIFVFFIPTMKFGIEEAQLCYECVLPVITIIIAGLSLIGINLLYLALKD
jgi:hypothetical protein